MQGFTEKIVNLMKSENLFESQGGPIILSQVVFLGFLSFLFSRIFFTSVFYFTICFWFGYLLL